jgi:hypothetical protein
MVEAEWLAGEDPEPMLLLLADSGASPRKARLFGCACVRRVWAELHDDRLRQALEVAERFADRLASAEQVEAARREADQVCQGVGDIVEDHGPMAVSAVCECDVRGFRVSESTLAIVAEARFGEGTTWDDVYKQEAGFQARILRDIFGNPFRLIRFNPALRTPDVVALARSAYDERALPSGELDPQRLAVLADALEEAGASEDVFNHLREAGPHVRGCWVVDLCLGKQ